MLYHFEIELSDIDRGLYESLDFRVVQHPSETCPYLLTRTLAYVLSYRENLEFSPSGLGDPDSAALLVKGALGSTELLIEIGNPSAKRLHKSSKMAKQVVVYTYKNADVLIKDITENKVHRAQDLEIYAFEPGFLQHLEKQLKKNNRWSILHQQGQLDINSDGFSLSTEVRKIPVS